MSKKKPISDEERADLVQQLMDDLEDFVAERSIQSRLNKDGATEDDKSIDEIAEVSTTVLCVFSFVFICLPLHSSVHSDSVTHFCWYGTQKRCLLMCNN